MLISHQHDEMVVPEKHTMSIIPGEASEMVCGLCQTAQVWKETGGEEGCQDQTIGLQCSQVTHQVPAIKNSYFTHFKPNKPTVIDGKSSPMGDEGWWGPAGDPVLALAGTTPWPT